MNRHKHDWCIWLTVIAFLLLGLFLLSRWGDKKEACSHENNIFNHANASVDVTAADVYVDGIVFKAGPVMLERKVGAFVEVDYRPYCEDCGEELIPNEVKE